MILALDHVNLLTDDLEGVAVWYEKVLGLKRGPRPPFSIAGEWLYLGENPVVHLVLQTDRPGPNEGSMEHFALRAKGMKAFEEHLNGVGVEFSMAHVPDTPIVQYNVHDPAGNHIHVDFDTSQEEAA
ncbi:MAG: VOC family protein [Pseudomonadota bacterium]